MVRKGSFNVDLIDGLMFEGVFFKNEVFRDRLFFKNEGFFGRGFFQNEGFLGFLLKSYHNLKGEFQNFV